MPPPTNEQLGPPPRRPVRVIIAEDDHDVRLGLARLLSFDGYDVQALSNGAELLDVFASWLLDDGEHRDPPADVLVTDVRMPGFNGLNIVEGLRKNGWSQPVIVISAFGDDAMRQRIGHLESVIFLDKPFDPSALEATLASMVAAVSKAAHSAERL